MSRDFDRASQSIFDDFVPFTYTQGRKNARYNSGVLPGPILASTLFIMYHYRTLANIAPVTYGLLSLGRGYRSPFTADSPVGTKVPTLPNIDSFARRTVQCNRRYPETTCEGERPTPKVVEPRGG